MTSSPQKATEELSAMQALFLWKLVLEGANEERGPLLKDFKPKLTVPQRKELEAKGLLALRPAKAGRGKQLCVLDAWWSWASEHGFAVQAPRSLVAGDVFAALLGKIGAYLRVHGVALDDLLRPRVAPAKTDAAEPTTEAHVRAAYLRATGGVFNEYIKLVRLRAELSEPDDAVNRVLLEMQQKGGTVLYPIDDPQALTPEDDAAAIWISGLRRDLLCVER